MATGHHRLRHMIRSRQVLTAAALLPTVLAVQVLAGAATVRDSDNLQLPSLAPLINANSPKRIPDQYIIIFKLGTSPEVALAAQNKAKELGGTIRTTYTLEPIGFSARLSEKALQVLREIPEVDYIEVNLSGSLDTEQTLDPRNWPKGLDRTSERGIQPQLLLDKRYTYSEEGSGVHVYVIDTGIFKGHSEFGVRVADGMNVTYDIDNPDPTIAAAQRVLGAADTEDCDGHGTHVAGIIGGTTFGIAKAVTLHPVRYTNCSGEVAADFAGKAVEWVTADVRAKGHPAVVNLSSSFPIREAGMLSDKVRRSMGLPLTYVVSAGNGSARACLTSPANIKDLPKGMMPENKYDPIVVGATVPDNDNRWPSSNWGSCVTLFAPGHQILSAVPNTVRSPGYLGGCTPGSSMSGSKTMSCSGTSMAAPHVTGVVARILGISGNGNLTPDQVWSKVHYANNVKDDPIGGTTTVGGVQWQGVQDPRAGSPNELLHYGSYKNGRDDYPPPPSAPSNLTVR